MASEESTIITEESIDNTQSESTHSTDSIYQENHIYGDAVQGDKVAGDKVAGNKYESQFFVSYHVQMIDESSETTRSIEVELTSEQERRIKPDVIQNLVGQLQHKQLLIVGDHPQMDKQELVDHLIWGFRRSYQKLSVWLWSEDVEEPNLISFLSSQGGQLSEAGIFVFREVFPSIFDRADWSYLQSALKERQQYLILTTSIPQAMWKDNGYATAFQADIPEYIFDPAYLVEELQTALINVNADELPQTIVQNIQTTELISGFSLYDAATRLSSPTNIHVFVARLYHFSNEIDKDAVTKLINEVHQQQSDGKIYYLYKQLGTDQNKLLVAGLCLFGELYEAKFFTGLRRVVQGPWRHMFPAVGIFDYFHLDPLYHLWTRQDNRIIHRQPNQRRSLLKFTWRSYQHHICEALPQLVPLVEDSVQPRPRSKTLVERQRDQFLRFTIGDVLGDVGRLSVPAVEDTLLHLASHMNFGVQATAARAIAQWAGQERELESQLFDLLERWQENRWQQVTEFPIDSKNIQLTVARAVYYILLNMRTLQLPDAMVSLLWRLLFNPYPEVRKYFGDKIQSKLFPRHLDQIIRGWNQYLPYPTSSPTPVYWVASLITFGRICDACGRLDTIDSWLINGLARSTYGGGHVFQALTVEQRQWLAQRVFPRYLRELHQLLLTLLQEGRSESGMVDVFVLAHQTQPQEVLQLLNDWRNRWQQTLEKQDEVQTARWLTALPLIGMIYGAVNEFQAFTPWLTVWLEQREWQRYAEIVSVLLQIYQYQTSTQPMQPVTNEPTTVVETPVIALTTPVETCLYDWLSDSKAITAQHQVALLFWNERQEIGIAKKCTEQEPPQLSGIAQLSMVLFSPNHQTTIRNLLPVALIIHQINAGTINTIIKQWRIAPHSEVNRIGVDLGYILWLSNAGCFFAFFLAPVKLLTEALQRLYPVVLKLAKWILVDHK